MRIGPEPTTDSFIAVMHGDVEGLVPGNALVVDPKKPFRKLNAFGNAFLNRWDLVPSVVPRATGTWGGMRGSKAFPFLTFSVFLRSREKCISGVIPC